MKAIETHFLGPTNYRGSRVTAKDDDGNRITLTWRHELNSDDNHKAAAYALCEKMHWTNKESLVCGALKNSYVWVFTMTPRDMAKEPTP